MQYALMQCHADQPQCTNTLYTISRPMGFAIVHREMHSKQRLQGARLFPDHEMTRSGCPTCSPVICVYVLQQAGLMQEIKSNAHCPQDT